MVFEDGSDVHYEYDEASRLTKKTDIDDKVTEYGYRKDHLLKTLTVKRESQSDRVFTYSYDEAGRVTQVQYPGKSQLIAYIDNGTPGTGWDRNGRLKHLRYELNGSPLRSFAYDYDESGNRTQATEVAGSTTTVYKYYYDWLDRLLRVEKGPNTSSLSPVSIYTYDESDNPTKLELPESFLEYDFTFDLASNIETRKETDTTVSSAPVVIFTENFTPDEDGNVLTRTRTVGADTHQITYEWDDFNKLVAVSASLNGSPAAEPKQSNAYAANGFRRQKTKKDGEIVTEYAEGLATAVAKAQAETITYIHGHQILGFEQGGQFHYFLTDALGSVRDIVDGTGQVVQQYQYDERGNHVIAPMSGGPASPKTFVGGLSVNDDTSDGGLYLMGHRFYDPSLGRFLNRDPIGFAGGLNLFSYGGNNPVTFVDPDGKNPSAAEYIPPLEDGGGFGVYILDSQGEKLVFQTNHRTATWTPDNETLRIFVDVQVRPGPGISYLDATPVDQFSKLRRQDSIAARVFEEKCENPIMTGSVNKDQFTDHNGVVVTQFRFEIRVDNAPSRLNVKGKFVIGGTGVSSEGKAVSGWEIIEFNQSFERRGKLFVPLKY